MKTMPNVYSLGDEAIDVHAETGLTPRQLADKCATLDALCTQRFDEIAQLADQRAELLAALRDLVSVAVWDQDSDRDEFNEIFDNALAALENKELT